jgi:hypothetical protein
MEYEEAKRKTKETLHPLKVELADLEDQVSDFNSVMENLGVICLFRLLDC